MSAIADIERKPLTKKELAIRHHPRNVCGEPCWLAVLEALVPPALEQGPALASRNLYGTFSVPP